MTEEQKGSNQQNNGQQPGWERNVLERLAFAALREQRLSRNWGIFFKLFYGFFLLVSLLFFFILIGVVATAGKQADSLGAKEHTALVELNGIIAPNTPASADLVVSSLRAAFRNKKTKGVIIRTNSPGGSPVQSSYIYNEIKRLRKKYPKIPVYAVITDVCASGCYYAIASSNKIYANESSIVGSIGVLMNGFGFVDAMKKLGIERRLLTAGKNKGILDPFSPLDPYAKAHAKNMLGQVHRQFIRAVKEGRGSALSSDKKLFSGLFWTGYEAKRLGLVDEMGSAGEVARTVIKAETIVNFTRKQRFLDRFIRQLGASMVLAMEQRWWMNSQSIQLR
jgi:protease IV